MQTTMNIDWDSMYKQHRSELMHAGWTAIPLTYIFMWLDFSKQGCTVQVYTALEDKQYVLIRCPRGLQLRDNL